MYMVAPLTSQLIRFLMVSYIYIYIYIYKYLLFYNNLKDIKINKFRFMSISKFTRTHLKCQSKQFKQYDK